MKKILLFFICVFLMRPITSYAFSSSDIISASNGLFTIRHNGDFVSRVVQTEDEFLTSFGTVINDTLRVCDYNELKEFRYWDKHDGIYYVIPKEDIDLLLNHESYVVNWLNNNLSSIVHDGVDRETAIKIVFDYIINNFEYDHSSVNDYEKASEQQGAYYILANGIGNCASYSKLFRGMIEAIPFNKDGIVDYTDAGTEHIKVAIVGWIQDKFDGHEWAAIQDPTNSIWYHYDLAYTDTNKNFPIYKLDEFQITGYYGHGRWTNWIYEY